MVHALNGEGASAGNLGAFTPAYRPKWRRNTRPRDIAANKLKPAKMMSVRTTTESSVSLVSAYHRNKRSDHNATDTRGMTQALDRSMGSSPVASFDRMRTRLAIHARACKGDVNINLTQGLERERRREALGRR